MMETLKFKTNLKCSGCVAAVQNDLDKSDKIESWEVDLTSLDKILTVKGEVDADEIVAAFAKAGYVAELVK